MEQEQIDIRKMNEEIKMLKSEFEKLKEDLEFARSTEDAWKEIEQGKFKKMSVPDFLDEIRNLE